MGDVVELDAERRRRAPPCPDCGGSGPVPPPEPEVTWRDVGMDAWLGLRESDPDAGWTLDPEQDPRVLGAPEEDE